MLCWRGVAPPVWGPCARCFNVCVWGELALIALVSRFPLWPHLIKCALILLTFMGFAFWVGGAEP